MDEMIQRSARTGRGGNALYYLYNPTTCKYVKRLSKWEVGPVWFHEPWKLSKDGLYFARMDIMGATFVVRVSDGAIYYR